MSTTRILAYSAALGFVGYAAFKQLTRTDRGIETNDNAETPDIVDGFTETVQDGFYKVSNMITSNNLMTPSIPILGFLKGFEKFRSMPYFATDSERQKGLKTIGYGHIIRLGENFDNGIDETEADSLFVSDVTIAGNAVSNYVSVPLTQYQYDALVSFVFNIGQGAFRKSTLLKKLNAGDYDSAANEFMRWVYQSGKVLNGLYKRRAAEMQIFRSGNYVVNFGVM